MLLRRNISFGCLIGAALAGQVYAGDDCAPALDTDLFCHPAVNGEVYASVVWDDGTGEKLYVAGAFTAIGCVEAQNIASWDGSTWQPLGEGLTGGTNGPSGYRVETLVIHDDGTGEALYAGGSFEAAGGDPNIRRLARWDGSQWSSVGPGLGTSANAQVRALASADLGNGPTLYAGGHYLDLDGPYSIPILAWDGSAWSTVGPRLNSTVLALGTYDDGNGPALYAGGFFSGTDEDDIAHLARWDGSSWSQVGDGIPFGDFLRAVTVITTHDDSSGEALYIGGQFLTSVGGVEVDGAARWDGSAWSALPELEQLPSTALSIGDLRSIDDGSGSALYAVGRFGLPGSESVNAARLEGDQWAPLGSGLNDYGWTISGLSAEAGTEIFVGGDFTEAGGIYAVGLARWRNSGWSSITGASGLNGRVLGLQEITTDAGSALAVGGAFTGADHEAADRIAVYNDQTWSPLDEGFNSAVSAVAQVDLGDGPTLYAGGTFTAAGNTPITRVAQWDGTSWQPLAGPNGQVTNSFVDAFAGFDGGHGTDLYAAGNFTVVGGTAASAIARWDGTEWFALTGSSGSGLNGTGRALAVFDDGTGPALYVGGSFTTAGGVDANYIARWDGSEWSALIDGNGNGLNGTVYALAVYDDGSGPALYAGGFFGQAGGKPASGVARWDGVSWSAISTEVIYGEVYALEVFDDGSGPALYIGGGFHRIGSDLTLRFITRWDGSELAPFDLALDGPVYALQAVNEDDGPALYIGGDFSYATTAAGISPKLNIAKWTGCAEAPCPADVTGDGQVDLADLNLVLASFGQQTESGDATGDGVVDLADLNAVLAAFGTACD